MRPGSEANHTTPSAEVKNEWALPLLRHYAFMASALYYFMNVFTYGMELIREYGRI
jgi:hypothetical protein